MDDAEATMTAQTDDSCLGEQVPLQTLDTDTDRHENDEEIAERTDQLHAEDPDANVDDGDDANSDRKSSSRGSITSENYDPNVPKPIDGGWGWLVVFGSFIIHVIADGIVYSFGIFYIEFLDYFDSTKGETSWVASLIVGCTFVTGPIASVLVDRYNCRVTTILGSVIAALGFILSTFATNIYFLYFSFGIVGGFGFGLIYLPAIVSVGQYFEKYRSLATGIAVCGSGVGTFLFAPLAQLLVHEYGWQGATLILTGLLLNCAVCGALFRPLYSENELRKKRRKEIIKKQKKLRKMEKANEEIRQEAMKGKAEASVLLAPDRPVYMSTTEDCVVRSMPTLTTSLSADTVHAKKRVQGFVLGQDEKRNGLLRPHSFDRDITLHQSTSALSEQNIARLAYMSHHSLYVMSQHALAPGVEAPGQEGGCMAFLADVKQNLKKISNFGLLRDVPFLLFSISNVFTSIGFNAPFLFLPHQAEMKGIGESEAAFLISVIGIANTVGRVLFGWLGDIMGEKRLYLYCTALAISGLCTALSPFCPTYPWLLAYAAAYGVTVGTYVTLTAVILVDLLGLENLVASFGLVLLFQGVATIVGPPMLGWVFDATGSYFFSFIIAGSMIGFSGVMLYCIPCVGRRKPRPVIEVSKGGDGGSLPSLHDQPDV